nr:flagellar hook-basal body complex protein FliE [uncultured Bacillus sp.]
MTNSLNIQKTNQSTITPYESQKSFSAFLKDSIEKVNQTQIESDKLTEKLISGQDVDLHQVMIAAQKASITTQLTLEIRNKAVEAYQEMMRMQV